MLLPGLDTQWLDCPYCGESFEAQVDCSYGSHAFIEDCPVCCRPIEFLVELDHEGHVMRFQAQRDDD